MKQFQCSFHPPPPPRLCYVHDRQQSVRKSGPCGGTLLWMSYYCYYRYCVVFPFPLLVLTSPRLRMTIPLLPSPLPPRHLRPKLRYSSSFCSSRREDLLHLLLFAFPFRLLLGVVQDYVRDDDDEATRFQFRQTP